MKKLFVGFLLFFVATFSHAQEIGNASFYSGWFNGKKTASGELFNDKKLTCAHKSLPFGTMLKVTNLANNKEVIVRVNDRGPYVKGRVLDLSLSAAQKLGFVANGTAKISYEIINQKAEKEKVLEADTASVIVVEKTSNNFFFEIKKIEDTLSHLYSIKIGTFEDLNYIVDLSSKIEKKYNHKVIVQKVGLQNGIMYRVYLGEFLAKEDAEKLKETVKKEYKESYVIQLGGMN